MFFFIFPKISFSYFVLNIFNVKIAFHLTKFRCGTQFFLQCALSAQLLGCFYVPRGSKLHHYFLESNITLNKKISGEVSTNHQGGILAKTEEKRHFRRFLAKKTIIRWDTWQTVTDSKLNSNRRTTPFCHVNILSFY